MASTLEMIQGLLWSKGIHIGKLNDSSRSLASMMGVPDYVAFPGSQMHDHCMTVARLPARKFYWNAELLVAGHTAVQRWYGMDGYMISVDGYNFEVEALGQKMIYSDIAMPTVDVSQPLVQTPADLAKLQPLDVSNARIPMMVDLAQRVAQAGGSVISGGMFCSPFSMLCQMMGYPAVIKTVRRNPEFAKDLFAFSENEAVMPFVKAQSNGGKVKNFMGADAWACFPNITVPMFREWVVPSARRLKQQGKQLGLTINAATAAMDYNEEDPNKFDKQLLFDCLDAAGEVSPLGQPVVGGAMGPTQLWDPHWLKEYIDTRGKGKPMMCVLGLNGRFVRDSKPDAIMAKVREWIDVLGRQGHIFALIGNVPADTPSVNVFAAVAAVHTYGRYPIARDLDKVTVEIPRFAPFDEWLKGQPEEETIRKAREK
jgi:uroporphyrinogen-III decarboxylase